jgi:hypothetical protein
MRSLSRLVIFVSMTVVLPTVADNSARAQDSQARGSVPALAPGAADPAADATPMAPSDEGRPKRKRQAQVAEAAPAQAAERPRFGGPAELNHHLQTGLSLMPGTGYRLIARYYEYQDCADASGATNKPVCARRVPTFLDLQLSFGAMARLDVIVDLRFGLEREPAGVVGSHQFAIAPGLRFWLDQERTLKFYATLQFVYDYTDFTGRYRTPNSDFGLRNANGLMYDPIRNVGFFIQFGESIGVRRWFSIDIDVGLGVQIRFP